MNEPSFRPQETFLRSDFVIPPLPLHVEVKFAGQLLLQTYNFHRLSFHCLSFLVACTHLLSIDLEFKWDLGCDFLVAYSQSRTSSKFEHRLCIVGMLQGNMDWEVNLHASPYHPAFLSVVDGANCHCHALAASALLDAPSPLPCPRSTPPPPQ